MAPGALSFRNKAGTDRAHVAAGQLTFRVWAENLPVVGAGLRDVRYIFLMRLRETVEAFTELIGTMIFALLGGVADPNGTGRDGWPALGNGLTLAVLVYMTAKVSGGKLNPAVSLGLLVSGSISPLRCLLEVFVQILGGVLGAAMSKYLTMGNVILANPGCFGPNFGIGGGQIFFWELTTTFVLVSVVFATAVDDAASGHFVSVAPLAIGLSLFACAQASGPFTGGCLNPARFLGPAIVFGCGWPWFAPYVFGQLLGGVLAGTIFRLRLKLQQMYKEHLEEMAARHAAEGGGEADDTPLTTIATPPASAA